ncbi:MAG: CPBP family intramembrane metalloprotease [Planctomycetaceae bacterium]|nr:CPBP family intramembrane metalloprotease [Planctomycetaceae bacterium]
MNSPLEIEPVELNSLEVPEANEPAPVSKPRKPRVWTVLTTLFLATIVGNVAIIASFVFAAGAVGGYLTAQGVEQDLLQTQIQEVLMQPLPALFLSLIPFQLTMTAFMLFAGYMSPEPMKQRLGLLPQTGRKYGGIKLSTMASFTMASALALNFAMFLLAGPVDGTDPINEAATNGSWITITILSIVISVIPALVEETLFRGYIQRRFLARWSPAVAITASTLLFAGMHMDSWQHIVAVIPLGAVTGLLAYRTNSVKPGMLVHGVHNVVAVAVPAAMATLLPILGEEGVGLLVLGAIPVAGLIGLPAVISLLRKSKPLPIVEAYETPEPVESLSVLKRAPLAAEYATDSVLTSQAL